MAKKNLLLVDADSKALRMLEVSLRQAGFSVTTASSSSDARDKIKHSQPDLIITDTKLPGDENGFELVANLKSAPETQGVPIIFLSSENKLELKVTGLELGVEDYLTKPIYMREVLTRVRVLLDKREKEKLERRERSSGFAGSLGEMGLVDLMQTVEIGRKSGRLFIESKHQEGVIAFREGRVCDCKTGRLTGERAFYRMLVWNEGTFSMDFSPHDEKDAIELSTQGLLMEGMRRVDEWGRLLEQLPPLDRVFEIDFSQLVDRLAEIPDEINTLLRLFDGRRTLLDVVDACDFGDLEALEIAAKLYFEGLIFDVADRRGDAEPSQVQKIEEWLEPTGVGNERLERSDEGDLLDARLDASSAATTPPVEADPWSQTDRDLLMPPPQDEVAATVVPRAVSATADWLEPPRDGPNAEEAEARVEGFRVPAPEAAASTAAPGVHRPLPSPEDVPPEPSGILTHAHVGAAAWSSVPQAADDMWQDVHASGIEGITASQTPVRLKPAPDTAATKTASESAFQAPTQLVSDAVPSFGDERSSPELPPELQSELSAVFDDDANTTNAQRRLPGVTLPGVKPPALADLVPSSADAAATHIAPVQHGMTPVPPSPSLLSQVPALPASDADSDEDPGASVAATLRESTKPAASNAPAKASDTIVSDAMLGEGTALATAPPASVATAASTLVQSAPSGPSTTTDVLAPPMDRRAPKPPPVNEDVDVAPPRQRVSVSTAVLLAVVAVLLGGVVVLLLRPAAPEPTVSPLPPVADAGVVRTDVAKAEPEPVKPSVVDAGPADVAADAGPATSADKPVESEDAPVADTNVDNKDQRYAQHLRSGEAFTRRGEHAKAAREYKAALVIKPSSVAAHLGLGNAHYELDQLGPALVHLEKARALAPRDPQAYLLLGAAYQSAGKKKDAVVAYRRYLELLPNGKFARDVRGILKGLEG